VIIQPGSFYVAAKAGNIDKILDALNKIYTAKDELTTTQIGIEIEFDMGLVTGRNDAGKPMTPREKITAAREYLLKINPEYLASEYPNIGAIPIGIYSGGPNEQGYNNINVNNNVLNNGNHIAHFGVEGIDDTRGNGMKFSDFYKYTGEDPYFGNLIYDINNFLFRGPMSADLKKFLLEVE
jgi:hypothetical protein